MNIFLSSTSYFERNLWKKTKNPSLKWILSSVKLCNNVSAGQHVLGTQRASRDCVNSKKSDRKTKSPWKNMIEWNFHSSDHNYCNLITLNKLALFPFIEHSQQVPLRLWKHKNSFWKRYFTQRNWSLSLRSLLSNFLPHFVTLTKSFDISGCLKQKIDIYLTCKSKWP